MTVFHLIYRVNVILIKISTGFLQTLTSKGIRIAKTILQKKIKVVEPIIPNCNTYYSVTGIKTEWYWHKDIQLYQWNRYPPIEQN